MKYTLIPSTLLAVAALATPAFADDDLLPTLGTHTWLGDGPSNAPEGWSSDIGRPSSITADVVKACYGTGVFTGSGWYVGTGNWNAGTDYGSDFSFTGDGFTFLSRNGLSGEYVAAVVELTGVLSTDELLTGFSISFDIQTTNSSATEGFHIYYVNTTTGDAVEFTSEAFVNTGDTTYSSSYEYMWTAASEDEYLSSDYALIFIWNSDGDNAGGSTVTVSNLSSSYTATPEPSMFGLMFGLGAIGLVATRRRRRA